MEQSAEASSMASGEVIRTQTSGWKEIEAWSLDKTSVPSRSRGHVDETTNLANKSGKLPTCRGRVNGLFLGVLSTPTHAMLMSDRNEVSGNSSALITDRAAPVSHKNVVGCPSMGRVIFAKGPPESPEDIMTGAGDTGLPES